MGPVISVLLGLIVAEVLWALLIRALLPRVPARFRARVWRIAVALAIVYACMLIIVMLTMGSEG